MGDLVKLIIENLADEIDFSLAHPHLGIKGRLLGKGLSEIVKTGVKYIK